MRSARTGNICSNALSELEAAEHFNIGTNLAVEEKIAETYDFLNDTAKAVEFYSKFISDAKIRGYSDEALASVNSKIAQLSDPRLPGTENAGEEGCGDEEGRLMDHNGRQCTNRPSEHSHWFCMEGLSGSFHSFIDLGLCHFLALTSCGGRKLDSGPKLVSPVVRCGRRKRQNS